MIEELLIKPKTSTSTSEASTYSNEATEKQLNLIRSLCDQRGMSYSSIADKIKTKQVLYNHSIRYIRSVYQNISHINAFKCIYHALIEMYVR